MAVGFIHGVMNTDNMTISGETIDYGPCAFVETFDENAVFSSIDHGGRYRFGQQPGVAVWNLSRLAECLLPLIGDRPDEAVAVATEAVEGFVPAFRDELLARHRRKLGLPDARPEDQGLVDDFLRLLKDGGVDHTLGWRALSASLVGDPRPDDIYGAATAFDAWRARWVDRLGPFDAAEVARRMDAVNPVHVPRNHLVEEAIEAANADDLEPLHALLGAVRAPFGPWVAGDRVAEPAPTSWRTLSASLSKSPVIFSRGNSSTRVLPMLPARTRSIPAERSSATEVRPVVSSMSRTDTPLLARLTTSESRSRTPSSCATRVSWTAARIAGRSGVTGTRMRVAVAKIARFTSL
jgi:uncharacterized protein YdiU (UPF0061 family)